MSNISSIIDFNQVPYGNAQVGPDGSVQCQHGPLECKGNMVELCAIHLNPGWRNWFPYLVCLEQNGERLLDAAQECATKTGQDWTKINACYDGGKGSLGKSLVAKAAQETNALNPPHQYTPWVVVNGKPVYNQVNHFADIVCKEYTGTPPAECSNPPTGQDDDLE